MDYPRAGTGRLAVRAWISGAPVGVGGLLVCLGCAALSQTPAAPASPIATDGTLGPVREIPLAGDTYSIPSNLGLRPGSGANLFHSFSQFDIPTGRRASFDGPPEVRNVIARVRNERSSRIDGTLASLISGANVFLLVPSGILFGAGARLDISGSFAAGTADHLTLNDGQVFSASRTEGDATLTASPPASFGFVEGQASAIKVGPDTQVSGPETQLAVSPGQSLQLVGGSVTIQNGAKVLAPGGRLLVAARQQPGEFPLTGPPPQPSSTDGTVAVMTRSQLSATGTADQGASGSLVIRGGRLQVIRGSLENRTSASGTAGAITDIAVADQITLEGTSTPPIDVNSTQEAGAGSSLRILADSIQLDNATIRANTLGRTGDGGMVYLKAREIGLLDSTLSAQSGPQALGQGPSVSLEAAERIVMSGTSTIVVDSYAAKSRARVNLEAEEVEIAGDGRLTSEFGGILAGTLGESPGGLVTLTVDRLRLTEAGFIRVDTLGPGDAGDIVVKGRTIALENGGRLLAVAEKALSGSAGTIRIEGRDGASPSGSILIHSDLDSPFDASSTGILAESKTTRSEARAGSIEIHAEALTVSRGTVSASSLAATPATEGSIRLEVGRLDLGSEASLLSRTTGSGAGGRIEILADSVVLTGEAGRPAGLISSESTLELPAAGPAGDILVQARQSIRVDPGATITVSAVQAKAGGISLISGGTLDLTGDSRFPDKFTLNAVGASDGNIQLSASTRVYLLDALISAKSRIGEGGNIFIPADSEVPGQTIRARVPDVVVLNRSRLDASAPAVGGTIRIETSGFVMSADSRFNVSGAVRNGIESVPTFPLQPPSFPLDLQAGLSTPAPWEKTEEWEIQDAEGYTPLGDPARRPEVQRQRLRIGP